MLNTPPKKRIPELKLTKLEVVDSRRRKPPSVGLPSVTTVIDGIPIVEYICNDELMGKEYSDKSSRSSVICLDSCDSQSSSPSSGLCKSSDGPIICPQDHSMITVDFSENPFSPEPVGITKLDIIRTDGMNTRKKPTRWDCQTRSYRIDARKEFECSPVTDNDDQAPSVRSEASFQLQPRDPRVKTFKKHHTSPPISQSSPANLPETRQVSTSVTYSENLMDISSPEYNPPSPFGSPTPSRSPSPAVPSVSKKKRTVSFFDSDSDSEVSEMDFSMGSKFLEMFSSSVDRVMPDRQGEIPCMGTGKRGCFWDSSSGEEGVDPARETLESIKLGSSRDSKDNYKMIDPKPKRRKATLSESSNSRRRGRGKGRGSYSSDDLETKYNKSENKRKPSRSKYNSSLRESRKRSASKSSKRSPERSRRENSPPRHEATDQTECLPHERRRAQHVCIYCGDRGHFSNDACPLRVCSMCFKIGHNFRECSLFLANKGRKRRCTRCQISCHERNTCGEIWRQCHNTTSLPTDYPGSSKKYSYPLTKEIQTFRVDQLKSSVYCCNCAKYGHTFFQCEKERPSRYFFIPLVGHHDIPMSAGYRELRRNVDTRRCQHQMLPKSFQKVKTQSFWGDEDESSSSSSEEEHSAAENGNQGDMAGESKKDVAERSPEKSREREVSRERERQNKPARYTGDTERNCEQLRQAQQDSDTSRALDLQQLEYQKAAINAYHLAFARAHRGESLYAREILNSRGFITVGAYPVPLLSESSKVSVEERRYLTPLVYLPDRTHAYSQLRAEKERLSPSGVKLEDPSGVRVCESHASFSRPLKPSVSKFFPTSKMAKYRRQERQGYKGKTADRAREREKRRLEKCKRANSKILDARECINRNRTKRHEERQVLVSRDSDKEREQTEQKGDREKRTSPSLKKDKHPSPKRVSVKKELSHSSERGDKQRTADTREIKKERCEHECDTFMCIDEAN